MRRARLFGFELDQPVAIEFERNGQRDSATIGNWGVSLEGEVSIELWRSALGVAPEGIYFEAQVNGFDTQGPETGRIYDPRMHELHYMWDFGDPGARFERPEILLPEWRDANISFGPRVAHTYTQPGTYLVTLTVTEPSSGKRATTSTQVTVDDPDTVFSGVRTIYVSPGSDWTHAPEGSVRVTSLDAATQAHSDSVVPRRFMFERGVVHPVGLNEFGERHANAYLCAGSGPAERPLLVNDGPPLRGFLETNWFSDDIPGASRDIVVTGLDLAGQYNAATGEGRAVSGIATRGERVGYLLLDDVNARGFHIAVSGGETYNSEVIHIFHDTTVTDWKSYGIYESRSWKSAFLGASVVQNPDGIGGHDKESGWYHGPYRGAQGYGLVIDGSEFYSTNGWYSNRHPYRTQQACVRFNQNGKQGGFLNMQRSSCEGGFQNIALSSQNNTTAAGAQNVILDKVLLIGSMMTHFSVSIGMGGVTVRNTLAIAPNVARPHGDAFDFDPRVLCNFQDPVGALPASHPDYDIALLSRSEPVRIYNNTFANLMSSENMYRPERNVGFGYPEISNFEDVIIENNAFFEPNMLEPYTIDGPLNVSSIAGLTPREKGYRRVGEYADGVLDADVADGASFVAPYPAGYTDAHFGQGDDTRHSMRHGGGYNSLSGPQDATFIFTPAGVSVENRSGSTWPAGHVYRLFLDHRNGGIMPPNESEQETPSDTIAEYYPEGGSPVLGDALNGLTAFDDLTGRVRPLYPSRGASEMKPGN